MTRLAERESHYLGEFETREAQLRDAGPSWLFPVRKAAISRFAEIGFPGRRDESWRYANLTPLARTHYRQPATQGELSDALRAAGEIPGSTGPSLVFVDGALMPELSDLGALPPGLTVGSLLEHARAGSPGVERSFTEHSPLEAGPFTALGTALFGDGAYVHAAAGLALDTPLRCVHYATGRGDDPAYHLYNLIVAEAGSRLAIVEIHIGAPRSAYFVNSVTDLVAEQDTQVDRFKIQRDSTRAYHVAMTRGRQERGSRLGNHFFSFGSALVRDEIDVQLNDEASHCDLNGLFVGDDSQHVDCHTTLHHAKPHCTSWEMYRGILGGKSTASFLGKINVYPDAQKTDAKQSNNNLLLSPDATVNTKPCLEIYADDVRCTHGATVGQLDEEAHFYLRTRGIAAENARNVLTHAFAGEVIGVIEHEPLRRYVTERLDESLPTREERRT